MCYSWEDFETGCSPLYRPNGEEDTISFSRNRKNKVKEDKSIQKLPAEPTENDDTGFYSPYRITTDLTTAEVRSNPIAEEYIGAPGGADVDINVDIQNGKYTAADIVYLLTK